MANIYDKASLVMIPSGTKASKIFSQKPVNGDGDFTFSRSTAATRVNADGLIEKQTSNIVIDSSNQSNISAFQVRNAIDSVTAVANPLTGLNNAYKITSNGTGDPYFGCNITSNLINGVNTFSCWLWTDSGQNTEATLFVYNSDISEVQTKGITLTTTPTRYEVFANISDFKGNATLRVDLCQSCGVTYLYTYGWQFEQGLVARDYIETTTAAVEGGITDNVPRLDYTDSSCPALLLEPQRQNLIPHSEYFGSGSGWSYFNNVSVGNFVLSPEGKMNATELIFDGTTSGRLERTISGLTSGADYSVSLYARVASGTQNVFFGSYQSEVFTLTTEWQRLERTQPENDTNAYPRIVCDDAATIEIWGFQHEAGSYATSYIPTYGTSVTRNYDTTSMLSLNNTSAAWTFFFDVAIDTCPNYNRSFLDLDTSAGSRRASFRWFNGATTNKISPYFDLDNVYPFSTGVEENDTDNGKIVLRHDGNGNFSFFNLRNSIATKRDYAGTPFTGSIIDIFGIADTTELENILFFPTALSDEECKTLVS